MISVRHVSASALTIRHSGTRRPGTRDGADGLMQARITSRKDRDQRSQDENGVTALR
jgi:hypothetical protein